MDVGRIENYPILPPINPPENYDEITEESTAESPREKQTTYTENGESVDILA
jgi:hypothetical protein